MDGRRMTAQRVGFTISTLQSITLQRFEACISVHPAQQGTLLQSGRCSTLVLLYDQHLRVRADVRRSGGEEAEAREREEPRGLPDGGGENVFGVAARKSSPRAGPPTGISILGDDIAKWKEYTFLNFHCPPLLCTLVMDGSRTSPDNFLESVDRTDDDAGCDRGGREEEEGESGMPYNNAVPQMPLFFNSGTAAQGHASTAGETGVLESPSPPPAATPRLDLDAAWVVSVNMFRHRVFCTCMRLLGRQRTGAPHISVLLRSWAFGSRCLC